MKDNPLRDIDALRRLVDYNPTTGALTWRKAWPELFGSSVSRPAHQRCAIWNGRWSGLPAFATDNGNGYLVGSFLGTMFKAHRVAWAVHHGEWPSGEIDHINGIKADNRKANIRDVCRSVNQKNASLRSDNASGRVGVSFVRRDGKWVAQISSEGKRYAWWFETKAEAVAARVVAEEILGFHANHGKTTFETP